MFVTDEKGTVIANFPPFQANIGRNFSDRDWYKGVVSTRSSYISNVLRIMVDPKPLAVVISVPIFDETSSCIGILSETHVLKSILDVFKPLRLDEDQRVYIIDRTGQVIFGNKDYSTEEVSNFPFYQEAKRTVRGGGVNPFFTVPDGDRGKRYLTIAPRADTDWLIVVERNLLETLRSHSLNFFKTAVIALLTFALVVVPLVYEYVLQSGSYRLLQLEKQRQAALELLHDVTNRVPGIVYEYVLRVDGSSFFSFMNKSLEDIYGISPEEVREDASGFFAMHHPEDQARINATLRNSARDLTPWNLDYRLRLTDGNLRWLSGNAIPQRRDDGSTVWHGVITDVTELKQTEMQLQRAQAQYLHAQKLSEAGKLSASIAHEVNSPLQAVLTVLMILRKSETLEEEEKRFLEQGIIEVKRIRDLIKILQNFYQPSSMKKVFLDVHRILDSLLLLLKIDFKMKRIELKIEYAEQLPHIYAVADQIKQVFLNLLTNAAEACLAKGGVITIRTRKNGGMVAIEIYDTGIGITPQDQDKIFHPFFTTKSKQNGSGLGLSISSEIVKNHGGKIMVSSLPGEGTSFTVLLPVGKDGDPHPG